LPHFLHAIRKRDGERGKDILRVRLLNQGCVARSQEGLAVDERNFAPRRHKAFQRGELRYPQSGVHVHELRVQRGAFLVFRRAAATGFCRPGRARRRRRSRYPPGPRRQGRHPPPPAGNLPDLPAQRLRSILQDRNPVRAQCFDVRNNAEVCGTRMAFAPFCASAAAC